MLNLVQLQERLKDMPIQALMQYANGVNPQVPPFLALGELNRRKKMQESAAAEQAQEMEGAPTVKQQIEQATGLMALQGSRQRQASQQQQTAQANMPMAAPNTTTSEPAQLAGGGFIDDIVVPRDYQGGGMAMNPDMIKKLMMLKAMKQRRPGIAGLPADSIRRADYAGGGIVAFRDGGSTFGEFLPDQAPEEVDVTKEMIEVPVELTGKIGLAQVKDIQSGKYGRTKAEILAAFGMGPKQTRQVNPAEAPRGERQITETAPPPAAVRGGSSAPGILGLGEAVKRFLKIDPTTAIPDVQRRTPEQFKAEREGLNKLFGVSSDPYADLKKRYGEIEAEDVRTRAEQPMDQLTAFLRGVASGPRGGTFGTQGAAGAAVSAKLREEQRALNRKQALDMATLRSAIAEKEDARARGDRDAFLAAQEKEKDAERAVLKDRLGIAQNQAQIESSGTQAIASLTSARKPTQTQEIADLLLSTDPRRQEVGRILAGSSKTGELTEARLLSEWNDLDTLAKRELSKLTPPVKTFEDYKNYVRGKATTDASSRGNVVDFSKLPK